MTHDCNQNIESNMTPAHCSVCGKEIPRTLEEEREAIVESLSNFIYRANTSMYKSQESREIDIKNSISHALLSHEEKVVARVLERVAKAIYDQMSYYEDGIKQMWVENGNSRKQGEARTLARIALNLPITDENV